MTARIGVRTGATCTGSTPSPSVLALEYDLQGNLAERDNVSYGFDFGNRLRTAPGNSRYAYDGLGRRVWEATTDDKYSHYLQNGQLSMTGDERRQKMAEYVYLQGSLIAIRERDVPTDAYTVKYQHTDALGSPVVVTDANRAVLERSEYEPYGRVTSPASPQDGRATPAMYSTPRPGWCRCSSAISTRSLGAFSASIR